jgi:hypothetical protein
MNSKDCLRQQLVSARNYSEQALEAFETPEQWVHQIHDGANHALWFAGHLAVNDNFFLSLIAPEKTYSKQGYAALFGVGSQPTGNPDDYPPPAEVLEYLRDRRRVLLEVFDSQSEADLQQKTADGAPDFLSDVGTVYQTAVWHEGLHSGQLSMVRRALGIGPVQGASSS